MNNFPVINNILAETRVIIEIRRVDNDRNNLHHRLSRRREILPKVLREGIKKSGLAMSRQTVCATHALYGLFARRFFFFSRDDRRTEERSSLALRDVPINVVRYYLA